MSAPNSSVLRVIVTIGILLAGKAALSSTPDSVTVYDIDEIVVTATRRSEQVMSVPFIANVQDWTDFQLTRQVRTIPDAMRETPGVSVQRTGHGQGSPYIRGFTGLRTLFLIDGIRLNNSTFREGPNQYWNTVDPWSVSRIEVVKGPSSVLYGSDAIGGTVNAISGEYGNGISPDDGYTLLAIRAASAEQSAIIRPEFGVVGQDFNLQFGLSLKDFGDLRSGGGTQRKTGYGEQDADLKLSWDLAEERSLVAAVQHVTQDDAWRTHKTIFGESWKGTTTGDDLRRSLDQTRTLAYVQYRNDDLSWRSGNLMLSLSWHQQDEERLRVRNDGRYDRQGTDVGTLGMWGQVEIPGRHSTWVSGIELYRDYVDSFRTDWSAEGLLVSEGIQGPVADNASYLTGAAYLQSQIQIQENSTVIVGARYTWSKVDANSVRNPTDGERMTINGDWRNLIGSIRLSHRLAGRSDVALFAGVSQGFRAPNLSDLTRFDSARSNEFEIPVANLNAEKFITSEIGIKTNAGRWAGQFAIYQTQIDGLIIRTPTGRIVDGEFEITKTNSSRGYVRGVELQARYRPTDQWEVFGNVAWVDGEVDRYDVANSEKIEEPLDRLMPAMMQVGARRQQPAGRHWMEGLVSLVDRQTKLSSRDRLDTDRIPAGGTPGRATFTLRGGWVISEGLGVSLAVENVFDKDYRTHGSGVNEAGRNFVASVSWQAY